MRLWNFIAFTGCIGLAMGLATAPARGQEPVEKSNEQLEVATRLLNSYQGNRYDIPAVQAWFEANGAAGAGGPHLQLIPADDAIRSQLKLPEGRGLIVTAVPSSATGVQKDDILLVLDDTPLTKPEDLEARLKAAGEKPLRLQFLHEGKPKELKIRPRIIATFVPEKEPAPPSYWIGVRVTPVSPALRAHLKLADSGLAAAEVIQGGPAEKAGLKVHDILLKLDDKPLAEQSALTDMVQKSGGKPLRLELVRAGAPLRLELKPEPRKEEAGADPSKLALSAENLLIFSPGRVLKGEGQEFQIELLQGQAANRFQAVPQGTSTETRLDAIASQVKELQKAVEELTRALKDRK